MPDGTIPFVTFTGVTVKAPPPQTVAVRGLITGAGLTTTVTSLETTADPHVGVEVQTIIQVPVPKIAPVGVNELPVCPEIDVIVPPVTVLAPH